MTQLDRKQSFELSHVGLTEREKATRDVGATQRQDERKGGRELEKQTRILKAEGTSVKLGKGLFGN